MILRRIISAVLASALVLGPGAPLSITGNAADKARVSVHDPSVIKADDGQYYVFGSHIEAARNQL